MVMIFEILYLPVICAYFQILLLFKFIELIFDLWTESCDSSIFCKLHRTIVCYVKVYCEQENKCHHESMRIIYRFCSAWKEKLQLLAVLNVPGSDCYLVVTRLCAGRGEDWGLEWGVSMLIALLPLPHLCHFIVVAFWSTVTWLRVAASCLSHSSESPTDVCGHKYSVIDK